MRDRWKAWRGLLLLGLIGGCYAVLPDADPQTVVGRSEADRIQMAMIRCANHTRSQLADPSGFDPEAHSSWRVEVTGSDAVTFRFRARARNGFGALVWAEFECRARHDGTRWIAQVSQI